MDFLDGNHVLHPNQFEFRREKSTPLASIDLVSDIFKSLEDNKLSSILFFDISRAFDTVNLEKLLTKLYNSGFKS